VKLLSTKILVGPKKLALPNINFASAKRMAQNAVAAIQGGRINYVILIAMKRAASQRP